MEVGNFNPARRRLEKQLDRERDDHELREGVVSRAELSRRNGFFSSLDLSRASVRRRRVLA
ncbi:hypothetical protein ACT9ST_24420 (plasmid) [Sphingobium limneticum]|mgnify:CR=1 FL=1|jgi:hypothetical protein|uniref:hypothetical protein n=1 Tax=Alphaproteobacteria TaxID=28211 RepID=UPI000F777DC0|nr:hypothetical protein [Nitrobacter sp.]QEH80894.1 hypothetical protein EIK56_23345 [Sphingomonas sp. C8-2]